MPQETRELTLDTPNATCQLARRLTPYLGPGDVLLLQGGVGAGKTHFARCLIQASLTELEDVPSPTYTLVQTYHGQQGEIWHADLYRLTDLTEVNELGLQQAFAEAICLVEWPDKLGSNTPQNALTLTLKAAADDNARTLTLSWSDPRWTAMLTGIVT